ncbi:Smg-6 [Mactra antiquata]
MAAETDVVRVTYNELEEIVRLNEEKEEEERKRRLKEEAKKKKEEERKKKRPTIGIYQPPHRNKSDQKESSPDKTGPKTGDTELHISEENWEEDLTSDMSSKESSVEKELGNLNIGSQDQKTGGQRSRKSDEFKGRRSKKPEIQRYIPKGKILEQQGTDMSGEGSGDFEDDIASPKQVHSPSPSPATSTLVHSPVTPSPRKIDLKNMQVTVVNDKSGSGTEDRTSPEKSVEPNPNSNPKFGKNNERGEYSKGRGQGHSHSRGRGQRYNQRSNKPNDTRPGRGQVGHKGDMRDSENKTRYDNKDRNNKSEQVNTKQEVKCQGNDKNKEINNDQEYIVPSRPSTIGQEADRKDTAPVGMEEQNQKQENVPKIDKQEILSRFKKLPNKTKSRSYDKLNQTERWEEEDGFYADPQNLGTMVFERSHSSEQLNLSGRNVGKPPVPRSASGGPKNVPKKYSYSGMRKRTDSFSSDLSTGTGSDWSTEELDFDKELDSTSKIDWNEDVERELALQVQDETQKLNEWFERQELGLSQKDSKDRCSNMRDNVMTSSTPGYLAGGFPSKSETWSEKSSTLPLPRRKQQDEFRGRTERRRGSLGFRSRDSSVSSVQSVQSVHSVQSAYSGDGRRRRRRRRKSSGGSQKMRSGSIEHMNISVTCGGGGNRREVKVDNFKGRSSENLSRQNSSEGPSRRGSRDEHWKGAKDENWRDRGYKGDDWNRRGGKGQFKGGRGRGMDKRGSYEQLDDPYHSRDRWGHDDRDGHSQQNERNRNYSGGRGSHNRRSDGQDAHGEDRQGYRGRGRGHDGGQHRKDRDYHFKGSKDKENRANQGGHGSHKGNRERHDSQGSKHEQSHGGGIIHLPPQSQTQDSNPAPQTQRKNSTDNQGWGRGQSQDRGGSRGRERQYSGSGQRQKTLFDPNNPSKPIVIEEAKPKMEFKDTDSYPSSPHSPQYMGSGPLPQQPPQDIYGNRGYGPGPYYPPGYGYGYNPMMAAPPGMFNAGPYGYQQQPPPPDGYRESSPYQDDRYYQSAADVEQQMIPGRSRSQCRMMAEQILREAIPLDRQLNHLISCRIGSEDTLHMINQLRRELQIRYEKLILLDPDLATKQNVEQMLWKSVFYHMVELIRKQLAENHSEETKMSLNKILDEGTTFYENLLEKLQKTFNFNLEDFLDPNRLPPDNLSRTIKLALLSAQRTTICLGDIARYKEQTHDGKVNYAKARNWYSKAQQIAPKNGRPYNQLAILALYTKHKLDAVYYYMRSLAASNPFLTARECLMTLFNEATKKAEANEKQRYEEKKKREGLKKKQTISEHRVEIWVKTDGSSCQSKVDNDEDTDLSKIDTVQLNKRFVLSFLNVHGKLFTNIGMEMFPDSCGQMLQEFKALLKDNAITPQRLLQLMAINMFAIENTALKDESLESTCKSLLQQHSVQMGLDMFGILVEHCSQLLGEHIKSTDYPGRMFSRELEELIPGIKVWTDWMISQANLWNPPPQVRDPLMGPDIDVWSCSATLCNKLKEMDTSHVVKFYTERDNGLEPVILSEDTMMLGFVPLLSTPLNSTFVKQDVDRDVARDCLRVEKLRVFGEYLCGVEPPMLAYDVETKKYYSVAPSDGFEDADKLELQDKNMESEDEDDVLIEDEEIIQLENIDDNDEHVQHLKARKDELVKKMEEKKRRQELRKNVIKMNRHSCIEIEIRPIFLIPDTNCFIDHLPSLKKLIEDRHYTLVIPLVVINELDGLAQGQRSGQYESEDHALKVKSRATSTIEYLENEFDKKNSHLKALTSKGNVMETISFRSEETDSIGNNDDLILSCCMYYCKDKARDFMPKDEDTPVHLFREVVLLTDDRNLRLKAHTHNVPVKDIPTFMKWSSGT